MNVTDKTVRFYRQSFKAFTHTVGDTKPSALNKVVLNSFVVGMRESILGCPHFLASFEPSLRRLRPLMSNS
jgi:hypothetical protein